MEMSGKDQPSSSLSINTDHIELIDEPNQFYEEIITTFLQKAKYRVILSALYLGTGLLEQKLIAAIDSALSNRLELQVSLIFDYSRSQRGPPSTLDLLAPLVKQHGHRLKVFLYELPSLRSTWCRLLPYQLREILGVYHCKFAVSDDTVCLTGANLSHEYFTKRQDRYWIVKEQSGMKIANFLVKFVEIVGKDSSILLGNNTLKDPIIGNTTECIKELQALINGDSGNTDDDNMKISSQLDANNHGRCTPVIQHAELGISGEEYALCHLLKTLCPSSIKKDPMLSTVKSLVSVQVATPYTNFPANLLRELVTLANDGGQVELIGPSQSAHGFASATGPKRYIPDLHREALLGTLQDVLTHLLPSTNHWQDNLSFAAYARNGWTYHTKGLWWQNILYPHDERAMDIECEIQTGCYIGSSNFGIRSWARDFELGFLFSTIGHIPMKFNEKDNRSNDDNGITEQMKEVFSINSLASRSIFVKDYGNLKRFASPDKQAKNLITHTGSPNGNAAPWWLRSIARFVKSVL